MLGPSLVLPGCVGIKMETYSIEGKKYSLTFFGMYELTCIEFKWKRQVKHVELFDAKYSVLHWFRYYPQRDTQYSFEFSVVTSLLVVESITRQ